MSGGRIAKAAKRVGWIDTLVIFAGYSIIVLAFANTIDGDEAAQIALGACIAGFLKVLQIWHEARKLSG